MRSIIGRWTVGWNTCSSIFSSDLYKGRSAVHALGRNIQMSGTVPKLGPVKGPEGLRVHPNGVAATLKPPQPSRLQGLHHSGCYNGKSSSPGSRYASLRFNSLDGLITSCRHCNHKVSLTCHTEVGLNFWISVLTGCYWPQTPLHTHLLPRLRQCLPGLSLELPCP